MTEPIANFADYLAPCITVSDERLAQLADTAPDAANAYAKEVFALAREVSVYRQKLTQQAEPTADDETPVIKRKGGK